MESDKIMLLFQLIKALEDYYSVLEKAYNDSDKERFDIAKKTILDISNKINYILT